MPLKMANPCDKRSCLSSAVQWCFYVFILVMCGYSFVKQHRMEQRLRVLEEKHLQLEALAYNDHEPKEELLNRKIRDVTDCICPSEITLQKKWKSLRGCFTREIKRQDKIKTGHNPGPRKSEYAYFQQLFFLRPVVASRPVCSDSSDHVQHNLCMTEIKREDSNKDGESINYEEGDEESDEDDPLREAVYQRKVKKPKYACEIEDEDKLFLLSMLSTLKRIPIENKIRTKIKLMTVLDEATRNLED